jgi:hypothetical protein
LAAQLGQVGGEAVLASGFGGQLALLGRDALTRGDQLLLEPLQPAQGIAGVAAGAGGGQLRRQGRIGAQEFGRRRGGRQPQGAAAAGQRQAGRHARWLRSIGPGGGKQRDRTGSGQQQEEQTRARPVQHAGKGNAGWMIATGAAIRHE